MITRAAPAALAALTLLSACADRPEPAPIVFRGSTPPAPGTRIEAPAPAAAAAPAPAVAAPAAPVQVARLPEPADLEPTGTGVIDYGGYSAIRARPGDTVASMAARVGLSPAALASYNGLPADWRPEAGDELILPPREGGYASAAAPTRVAAAAPAPAPAPAAASTGLDLNRIEQGLATPTPAPAAQPAAAPVSAPAPAATPTVQPERVAAATPAPAPAAPAPAASTRFIRPVQGEVLRSFNPTPGPNRSNGIDFAAEPGSAVVAAAAGRVALITEPVGVDGAIVMVDHGDDLLAIYGRLEDISVSKGDTVSRGETLGRVAPANSAERPYLQFEVIRGTESVDPADLLG